MRIEREPEVVAHIPRAWRCVNPWCDRSTRCPGEVCKRCRFEIEKARAAFRRVLNEKQR